MLDEILLPSFDVEYLVESKPIVRRLHDAGINAHAADPRRTDTYLKADLTPGTCVIIEDTGRRSLRKILEAVRDAGGTLVYVIAVGISDFRKREELLKTEFPDLYYVALSELFGDQGETRLDVLEPPHDRFLGCGVDRRRLVPALAVADARLALEASRHPVEHGFDGDRGVAADLEPVGHRHSSKGEKRRPLVSLG